MQPLNTCTRCADVEISTRNINYVCHAQMYLTRNVVTRQILCSCFYAKHETAFPNTPPSVTRVSTALLRLIVPRSIIYFLSTSSLPLLFLSLKLLSPFPTLLEASLSAHLPTPAHLPYADHHTWRIRDASPFLRNPSPHALHNPSHYRTGWFLHRTRLGFLVEYEGGREGGVE